MRAVVGEMDEQGRHRVGAPQICDSHKPDDFQVVPFHADNGKPNSSRFSRDTGVALRIFRPPFTAKVRSNQGKPAHITFAECSAPIVCAAGPWFRSGLWWHETQCWSREDWDIAIRSKDGVGLYRIYHQGHHWFVEGLYD
jgi:hypothetical protein